MFIEHARFHASENEAGHGSGQFAFANEHLAGALAFEQQGLLLVVTSHGDFDIGVE